MKAITPSARRGTEIQPPAEVEIGNGSNGGKKLPKLNIKVNAPKIQTALFEIEGTTPLVVHRFSTKAKQEMIDKMINPPAPGARARHGRDARRDR